MEIYSRLKVPEIWRFDVEILNKKGRYEERERSKAVSFLRSADVKAALAGAASQSRTKLLQFFRKWIREQIDKGWQS